MIVHLAKEKGYVSTPTYNEEEINQYPSASSYLYPSEEVIEESELAIQFLNDNVAVSGYFFAWDDGEFWYEES